MRIYCPNSSPPESQIQREFSWDLSHRLHQQFLPSKLPQIEGLSIEAYFQPSNKLGGDFYDVIDLGEQLLFYLSDVSGHGLDGSILNIFLRQIINNYLLDYNNQSEFLNPIHLMEVIVDKYLEEDFPGDYFICLLIGVFDKEEEKIVFANAGFQFPPLKVTQNGEVKEIFCSGPPISSVISKELFLELIDSNKEDKNILLKQGESILLTTDGLLEEFRDDEIYGEERLAKILSDNATFPASLILEKIKDDFKEFSGSLNGQDDLTLLVLKKNLK